MRSSYWSSDVCSSDLSRSPIVLYGDLGWGALGGLTLRVSRMDGELVVHDKLDHDMIVPSTLQQHGYYSTLFRNQFIGISRTAQDQELFTGPEIGRASCRERVGQYVYI